jgi:hypothetical protein
MAEAIFESQTGRLIGLSASSNPRDLYLVLPSVRRGSAYLDDTLRLA